LHFITCAKCNKLLLVMVIMMLLPLLPLLLPPPSSFPAGRYAKFVYRCTRDTCSTEAPAATTAAPSSTPLRFRRLIGEGDDGFSDSYPNRHQAYRGGVGSYGREMRRMVDASSSSSSSSSSEACWILANFNSTACSGSQLTCAEGSGGPMCGACIEGYAYSATVVVAY